MYLKIIGPTGRSPKARLRALLAYARMRRGARIAWRNRFGLVFASNPEFKRPVPAAVIGAHRKVWNPLRRGVNLADLQIAFHGNKRCDPRLVPEEVFMADVEPTLNRRDDLALLSNKSLYYKLYDPERFPRPFLHVIERRVYDSHFQQLGASSVAKAISKLPYPVLLKPNRGTSGGKGVKVVEHPDELRQALQENRHLVVQELLRQHPFFERFNTSGLNTVRVNLYRSVADDTLVFLNCALRMGVGGSLDNLTAGGIVVHIDDDGKLSGMARDKYGKPLAKHPDTGLQFHEGIPYFEQLKKASLEMGSQVLYGRLFSLDLVLDQDGAWRVIEINMHGQTIRFAQYAGRAFFGDYTDEVVDYCLREHWAMVESG